MLTLSNGFKKPEINDKGPTVFPALEGNIQQLNDHNHDGDNSEKLLSSSIDPLTATLVSGDWSLDADGIYKQTVSLPAALDYDKMSFEVRLPSGHLVFPQIEKVGSGSYDIFTNDNSVGFTVIYS